VFGLIADAIAEFVEDTPDDEWRAKKILITLLCVSDAVGHGDKVTDVQWAHLGWFGTAEEVPFNEVETSLNISALRECTSATT
jgi:hypothetical protein